MAEMRLYPFDVEGQGRQYFVLSTDQVWSGAYGEDNLGNQNLDESFTFLSREFGLTTKTRAEMAAEVSNVPQISADLEAPIPGVWYRIRNTMYPGKSFILYHTQQF